MLIKQRPSTTIEVKAARSVAACCPARSIVVDRQKDRSSEVAGNNNLHDEPVPNCCPSYCYCYVHVLLSFVEHLAR
eukprot:scaffold1064_cov209-Skeletonema_marinoi.AAC.12